MKSSSEARDLEMPWENPDTSCVEERYGFLFLTQYSPPSPHALDRTPHSEEFFG